MDVLAFKETRVVICDTCHTWGVLLGCSDIYSTTSVYLATTIDLVQHQPICQAQSKCLLSAACSLSLLYAVWTSVPSTCLFLSPYHLGPVFMYNLDGYEMMKVVFVDNLIKLSTKRTFIISWLREQLRNLCIQCWLLFGLCWDCMYMIPCIYLPFLISYKESVSYKAIQS